MSLAAVIHCPAAATFSGRSPRQDVGTSLPFRHQDATGNSRPSSTVPFLNMSAKPLIKHEVAITFLRNTLGLTVLQVAQTDEPVIVSRYNPI